MTAQEKLIIRALYIIHQEVMAILSSPLKQEERIEYTKKMNDFFLKNVFLTDEEENDDTSKIMIAFNGLLDAWSKIQEKKWP